jgi:hypothetical protein
MVNRLVVSKQRSGRVDDEGSDLLLNSDRGAGGRVVVSKEEVAAGRKVAQKKEELPSELIVD